MPIISEFPFSNMRGDCESIDFGHLDIENQNIEFLAIDLFQGFASIGNEAHAVVPFFKQALGQQSVGLVIVGDQDAERMISFQSPGKRRHVTVDIDFLFGLLGQSDPTGGGWRGGV